MSYFYNSYMFKMFLSAFSFFSIGNKPVIYDSFKELIGMGEQQFFDQYGFSDAGKQFLKNKLEGKQGTFYVKQVEPFDSAALAVMAQKENGCFTSKVKFSIIEGGEIPTGKSFQRHLDVAALQALPENNGAVFQVASNLNALELNGTKKERIYTYIPLRTQGEICALSAMPGIIDRMYLQSPINFLKNFNWQGPVTYTEGYFPCMSEMNTRFKDMTYDDIVRTCSTLSVGVQKNVRVTSGLRDYIQKHWTLVAFKAVPVQGIDQRITQVFTAALDPYNNSMLTKTLGFENLARTLLHGAYKGTFDVAYDLKAKKIFLTLVGGGVFQNKFEWIAEALQIAFLDFSYKKGTASLPVEVVLILYHIPAHQKLTEDWKKTENCFKWLVFKSNGTWTRYMSSGKKVACPRTKI